VACQKDYATLDSCIHSSSAFQNFANIIFDPVGFYSAFRCACGDAFLKVYPLCIYCFQQTGQTNTLLNTSVPPSVERVRAACQTASAIAGNASGYDQTATSSQYPQATGGPWAAAERLAVTRWETKIGFMMISGIVILISII
jgi:cell division cycle 20, cofactor of APC complex